jgi:hypothetical protein
MLTQYLMTKEIVTSLKICLKYKQAILAVVTHESYHYITKSDKKVVGTEHTKAALCS